MPPDPGRLTHSLRQLRLAQRELLPPVVRVQSALHSWVAYGVTPLFALANAGVSLRGLDLSLGGAQWVVAGIMLALVVGNTWVVQCKYANDYQNLPGGRLKDSVDSLRNAYRAFRARIVERVEPSRRPYLSYRSRLPIRCSSFASRSRRFVSTWRFTVRRCCRRISNWSHWCVRHCAYLPMCRSCRREQPNSAST